MDESAAFDRQSAFNHAFSTLPGRRWTDNYVASTGTPPLHLLAAWPWRREVYYVYFMMRRSLGRAYDMYTRSLFASWSDMQRELERLLHACAALSMHNAFADRIAQLANAAGGPKLILKEKKVCFHKLFKEHPPATLPLTWAGAAAVEADEDFRKTRKLGNDIKHRWSGSLIVHLPTPASIRAGFTEGPPNSLKELPASRIDELCRMAQRSFNLLVDLAAELDRETDWERYFVMSGDQEDEPRQGIV